MNLKTLYIDKKNKLFEYVHSNNQPSEIKEIERKTGSIISKYYTENESINKLISLYNPDNIIYSNII